MRAWNVIVPEMKDLIQDLQCMAAEVYQKEEEQCSHRLLRTNFQIANVGAARSLQDITGTPAVLLKLHTKLSRIVLLANYSPSREVFTSVNPFIIFYILSIDAHCVAQYANHRATFSN